MSALFSFQLLKTSSLCADTSLPHSLFLVLSSGDTKDIFNPFSMSYSFMFFTESQIWVRKNIKDHSITQFEKHYHNRTKVFFISRLKISNISIILQISVSRHCFILITLLQTHCLSTSSSKSGKQNWEHLAKCKVEKDNQLCFKQPASK